MKQTIVAIMIAIAAFINVSAQVQNSKPNIICIVADDLGYSDIGCYGGEINTPNLNKLANEGVRLSNMHNASMCVLSRTSLLSGKWWPTVGSGLRKGSTVAEELKSAGYRTGIVGKWHLQGEPNDKGFDYFFGFLGGFSGYYSGGKDYRENKVPFTDFGKDYYSTDAFTNKAIEFIKPNKDEANPKPFFLYLAYQSPHNPLQAPKDDVMKYRGKYLKGWQAIREARIKNQIKFGVVKAGTALVDYPQNLPNWETLTPEQKDLEDLRMSVYAAMVEKMDNGIGKLMNALKENGQANNTMILFLSDNGNDPFSSTSENMLKKGILPGEEGGNWQIGMGWAYAGVTPYRLYKISQHGGGVTTGAIAWYPSLIKQVGKIDASPLHVVDIMPTFLNIANAKKSSMSGLSGQSFLPVLKCEGFVRKEPMFFQFEDNRAIRTDKWCLTEVDGNGWELYNIITDALETNDISKQNPKVVEELAATWFNWWKTEGNKTSYEPKSTKVSEHYSPQGDRGSGKIYQPSAMPIELSKRYK